MTTLAKWAEARMQGIERIVRPMTIIPDKEPEAPESALMGQWAWPTKREGFPKGMQETPTSKRLYEALRKHFETTQKRMSLDEVNTLREFLLLGYYEPVLHSPPQKRLYRGLHLTEVEAVAFFRDLGITIDENNMSEQSQEINRHVPALNGFSSSWTAVKKITDDFAIGDHKSGYAITLIADVKDNPYRFLAGPGGLYNVQGLSMFHLERETVGLEPIVIKRIEWMQF